MQPSPGSGVVQIVQRTAGASGVVRARPTRTLWTETPSNIAALHSAPSETESPAQLMLAAAAADPSVMWHQGAWVSGASPFSRQRLNFGAGPAQ